MAYRKKISRRVRDHYEAAWRKRDPWDLTDCEFEQRRYAHLLSVVADRRYPRVLELGCGSGGLTCLLAGVADHVLAVDVAPSAVDKARAYTSEATPGIIELRAADIMMFNLEAEGPWDLIVLTEAIYCIGWLHSFFDVAYLAARLFEVTTADGRLLLSNTYGQQNKDWLLQPYVVDTYRDLFRNVGYGIEAEHIYKGTKHGVELSVLVSLFVKTLSGKGSG